MMALYGQTRPAVCSFFRTKKGCKKGSFCDFSHAESQPSGPKTSIPREVQDRQTPQEKNSDDDAFYEWRRLIPRSDKPQFFGPKLDRFFQAGLLLVQGDLNILQRTITELATEQGALAIREMIDDRTMYCPTNRDRIDLWRTCISPLFQMLTEPRVARSAILEVHTGTIYNVVLGSNDNRLDILYTFLVDLAAKWDDMEPSLVSDDETKSKFLEACTHILAKVIDSNTKNLTSEVIPKIASQLQESVASLGVDDLDFWSLQATKHLEYIQRRLEATKAAKSIPRASPQEHSVCFLPPDLPGKLSPEGPRHDNDSDDITEIQILPTMSEIKSKRADYRPVNDPTQLHMPGIQGLIDRQFRLLREDMVGPLKECVSEELQVLDCKTLSTQRIETQTHSYNVVDILDATCTRQTGLEFHLKIEQPLDAAKLSSNARKEWWRMSKRLEPDALVCFMQRDMAIFCVVSESTQRPNSTRKNPNPMGQSSARKYNLHSNKDFAYVSLSLVGATDQAYGLLMPIMQKNRTYPQSLVEFPRVLLPAFRHTLLALQNMSKSMDLPFTEFLAPYTNKSAEGVIPLPLYATKPQFAYNLQSLTSDGEDLFYFPKDEPNPLELCQRSSLDYGQSKALLNALRRSLALIQGPPGTGKSYTGEAAVKVLLATKEQAETGPILCVCYTNHALDQMLENLWHGGVKKIIRIGSKSKSSILADLNLRNVGKDFDRTKSEKIAWWESNKTLIRAENDMQSYLKELGSTTMTRKFKEYIHTVAPKVHDAIFGAEEEGWTIVTQKDEHTQLLKWISAGSSSDRPPRNANDLQEKDPETLSRKERQSLCAAWGVEVLKNLQERFVSLYDDYQSAKHRHGDVAREVDLRVLQTADIVGVTTTGLAKNLDLLRHLGSKILICEEAGEILESHALTALLPSVEHAILIGDHMQLRPHIVNYDLSAANPHGEKYSFDVSLFERLIQPARSTDLKLPFDTLEIQRRMHPSISNLIRNTLYNSLQDDERVRDYPEVPGMRKRLFWFDHREPEAGLDPSHPTGTSSTNDFEVDMVSALVSHLVRQGVYGRNDIAVLTPYLGQLRKLRGKLQSSFEVVVNDRDLEELHREGLDENLQVHKQQLGKCLRLATVDNFQGEEAKVIVVSLVRSNQGHQCGFLRTTNRINVLLSRAQHGMYLLGDSSTYERVEMWSKVITMLKQDGNFGTKLPLQCPRHEDKCIEVSGPEDFARLSPEAGCDAQCSLELDCGHTCLNKCHAVPLHKVAKCLTSCPRFEKACGHSCPKLCGESCEKKCSTVLEGQEFLLPCGHSLVSPQCWQSKNLDTIKCRELVEKTVPGCDHKVKVACHEDIYGRIDRQVLDRTKPFARQYSALCTTFEKYVIIEQERLDHEESDQLLELVAKPGDFLLKGALVDQLASINNRVGGQRYLGLIKLYSKMSDEIHRITEGEGVYQREHGEKSYAGSARFRTWGLLVARIARFRCYLAGLDDFMRLRYRSKECLTVMHFDLDAALKECETIISFARLTKYTSHEIEGRTFYAKIAAMTLLANDIVPSVGSREAIKKEDYKIYDSKLLNAVDKAKGHLIEAELSTKDCDFGAAARKDFEVVFEMLFHPEDWNRRFERARRDSPLTAADTFADTTRRWYACTEGHPFTLAADDEPPLDTIKCPSCKASVAFREG